MELFAHIEISSIVMLTQDQVEVSSLIFENILKFHNLSSNETGVLIWDGHIYGYVHQFPSMRITHRQNMAHGHP